MLHMRSDSNTYPLCDLYLLNLHIAELGLDTDVLLALLGLGQIVLVPVPMFLFACLEVDRKASNLSLAAQQCQHARNKLNDSVPRLDTGGTFGGFSPSLGLFYGEEICPYRPELASRFDKDERHEYGSDHTYEESRALWRKEWENRYERCGEDPQAESDAAGQNPRAVLIQAPVQHPDNGDRKQSARDASGEVPVQPLRDFRLWNEGRERGREDDDAAAEGKVHLREGNVRDPVPAEGMDKGARAVLVEEEPDQGESYRDAECRSSEFSKDPLGWKVQQWQRHPNWTLYRGSLVYAKLGACGHVDGIDDDFAEYDDDDLDISLTLITKGEIELGDSETCVGGNMGLTSIRCSKF